MNLVVDIGNTNIVLGLFKQKKLVNSLRTTTDFEQSQKEYQIIIYDLLKKNIKETSSIQKVIICSVVPKLTHVVSDIFTQILNIDPIILNSSYFQEIKYKDKLPEEAGMDRLVNAYIAYKRKQTGLIIIDFGTATTFDIVNHRGEYLGGVIMPGLILSFESLIARVQHLPTIKLIPPKQVIGNNTIESLQSGVIYGYSGMIDSMIDRIIAEHGSPLKVIATGGLVSLLQSVSTKIDYIEDNLTLYGIFELGNKNTEDRKK